MSNNLNESFGRLITNILAIEYLMREAIDKHGGDSTKFDYFGKVRKEYNKIAGSSEAVGDEISRLRNALAHGLIAFDDYDLSIGKLFKFKRGSKDIEYEFDLTKEWLDAKIDETREALLNVAKVAGISPI